MGAYLIDHPPVRDQWYAKRKRPLTGCTVLHTAEGVLDTIGPDTGAEATAEFIRTRTTAGSYHDLVDADSWVPLIPYQHGAYHDGTGSNNWALSISFACCTSDWRAMTPAKRQGFLRQGARAFAAQQAWRRANGYPTTELRLITRAQSDAGMSGFTYHGLRDPSRRTDPGVAAPNLFPFDEWIAECRAALGSPATPTPMGDPEMRIAVTPESTCWILRELSVVATGNLGEVSSLAKAYGVPITPMTREEVQECINSAARAYAALVAGISKAMPVPDIDEKALAAELLAAAPDLLAAAPQLTEEDIQRLLDDSEIDTVNLLAARLSQRVGA